MKRLFPILFLLCAFSADDGLLKHPQELLTARYDADAEPQKLKKFDLQLTPDGFFRLKKTFVNGKQEYFSFSLKKFGELDYSGTTRSGYLLLKTVREDIIVQTYNDRKGDIDTMASTLALPLRDIEPEQLDSLSRVLSAFKARQ